jgi:tetratricopeptide (TPR) repeat protein
MRLADVVRQFVSGGESDSLRRAGVHFDGKMSQLRASRCFSESGGALGCLSCHWVHGEPSRTDRVESHRRACLACHEQNGCSLPLEQRRAEQKDDACAACHMPAVTPADIIHSTITDHRIRRPNEQRAQPTGPSDPLRLTPLTSDEVGGVEEKRNLGIAYGFVGKASRRPAPAHRRAVELLEVVRAEFAGDIEHRLALGRSLSSLGEHARAISAFQEAVALGPANEEARNALARELVGAGMHAEARVQLREALKINPLKVELLLALARIEERDKNWPEAEKLYGRVLELSHGNADATLGLGYSLLQQGRKQEADELLRKHQRLQR